MKKEIFKKNTNDKDWKLYESAFIKAIRRCNVDDALYWTTRLFILGKVDLIWRRIWIHLSEDIGLANEILPSTIESLYQNYNRLSVKGDTSYESDDACKLPLFHAVMLLAKSPKSREVDNAMIVHFYTDETREVPDYCIDIHSPKGRRLGRGVDHFFQEAGKIENEVKVFPNYFYTLKAYTYLRNLETDAK